MAGSVLKQSLSGNSVTGNKIVVTSDGNIELNPTSTVTINGGLLVATTIQATTLSLSGSIEATGGLIGDVVGSIFADDSTQIIDGLTGNVFANELSLGSDLTVQYGGTGRSTFTTNGIIYGNSASGLLVTAASNPGSNATTSYGVLTTNGSNVPTWTDVIDGGTI
jgi:hypothetical protein